LLTGVLPEAIVTQVRVVIASSASSEYSSFQVPLVTVPMTLVRVLISAVSAGLSISTKG
jgi:hypothetical protein